MKKIAVKNHVLTESNGRISRISTGYHPDIKAFCTPDIISCHPLSVALWIGCPLGVLSTNQHIPKLKPRTFYICFKRSH